MKTFPVSIRRLVATLTSVSFALNFAWEMLQAPLFSSMRELSLGDALITCARAALGDVVLTVVTYLVVGAVAGDMRWGYRPAAGRLLAFCVLGIVTTVALEIHATRTARWTYADSMPLVPLLGVAWVPVFQWAIVPPLCIATLRFVAQWRGKRRP